MNKTIDNVPLCGNTEVHELHGMCDGVTPLDIFAHKMSDAIEELAWVTKSLEALGEVQKELKAAVEKHGFSKTPMNPDMDPRDAFIILTEEVGEVAETFTYDNPKKRDREHELIQVAAMAVAMLIGHRSKNV